MIIKFLTRKNIYSAKQLARYVLTDRGRIENPFETAIIRNVNRIDLDTIHRDFIDNHKFQKKRKNGTALLHEIIAVNKLDREKITKKMMQDFMNIYIKMRGATNALCIMQIHEQHIHVMLSSNEVRSKKLLRMSHKQMNELLINFEKKHIELYPQLEHSVVHTKKRERTRRNIVEEEQNSRREREHQMKRNMPEGKLTQKEIVFEKVSKLFDSSTTKEELVRNIQESQDLSIYTRNGSIQGVITNGSRKYKFTTLGVSPDRLLRLERVHSRLEDLKL
jgi:hypothetical protein